MRLFTRLLLSHCAPLLVTACAVALTLAALVRMTAVLSALGEDELGSLRREGDLHRAAWVLDVSMRHGYDDCVAGRQLPRRSRVEGVARDLRRELQSSASATPVMTETVRSYLALADDMLAAPELCRALTDRAYQERREVLDEELTNLWVARLDELHAEVTRKEGEARQIGRTAAVTGMVLAAASLLLAALIAARMAQALNRPLTSLAGIARRVGRGDFRTAVAIEGPVEIMELANELERMRLQLEQLETLKQGILASISHELRTPLSKIREALALLADGVVGALEPRQTQVVRIARDACEREIRLVTTLLDLSRLRAGSPIRVLERCSVDRVLERALEDERSEAESRGVALRAEHRGEAHMAKLDPVLVERSIANLVRNAVAVSHRGQEVTVTREVLERGPLGGASSSSTPWLRITVEDRGPGVPEQIRQTIFDAFVTRAVPQSSKGLGFGLGLALAREVARAHGGELVLDEACDVGAKFHLWLPLSSVDVPRPAPRSLGLAVAPRRTEDE